MNNEDIYIDGKSDDFENTILITLKDTNNLVKILYDKINLLESENTNFKKQIYYLNKNIIELKEQNVNLNNKIEKNVNLNNKIEKNVNLNNKIEQNVNLNNKIEQHIPINKCNTDTDLNDFIINSVNEYNIVPNIDNNESVINESDIINEINFISKIDKDDKGDKGDIKNKLKKLIIETQQNAININKRKKNMLFTMR